MMNYECSGIDLYETKRKIHTNVTGPDKIAASEWAS